VARELCCRLPEAAPDLRFDLYAPSGADGLAVTVLPATRLFSQLRLPIQLWRRRPDLLFAPAHVVPFLAPARAVTIVHDLAFERHPDAYPAKALRYLRLTTRWAERRCIALITPSEATRRDLLELHGVDPRQVVTVHPGGGQPAPDLCDEEVRQRLHRLGVRGDFVLQVGRVEQKKNPAAALAAVRRLDGPSLVLVGARADTALADRLEQDRRCLVLGQVGDLDRDALYRGTLAVVMPSRYEGFGFPVLEALRRGVPVVASRTSSLPEVGGDAAAYVDDPDDSSSFATTLARAIADRAERADRGRAQAARFTWERCAAEVASVLRIALS
jgi:glycosyltransferase involved in cell wall biosynthesis